MFLILFEITDSCLQVEEVGISNEDQTAHPSEEFAACSVWVSYRPGPWGDAQIKNVYDVNVL